MVGNDFQLSLARRLHLLYARLVRGDRTEWRDLDGESRGMWLGIARRTIERIAPLAVHARHSVPAGGKQRESGDGELPSQMMSSVGFSAEDVGMDKAAELSLAKSMHWSFSRLNSGGSPTAWKALTREERILWVKMARRAVRRLEQLKEGPADPEGGRIESDGSSAAAGVGTRTVVQVG